jgi:hypothetical protein
MDYLKQLARIFELRYQGLGINVKGQRSIPEHESGFKTVPISEVVDKAERP